MRFLTLIAVTAVSLSTANLQAEESSPQDIEWNVFLADWHLLGPFPKEDESGLETEYVPDEASLSMGQVYFYKNKLYAWKPYAGRVIDFRKGLGVNGNKGENKVGYAWTQFSSPVAQKVKMSVAYDDNFVGWLNGKEVARGTDGWASSLDQEVVEVDLKAGVNTLLIRLANGRTKWDAAVRFIPVSLKKPLFTFKASPANNNARLPVINVQLLDKKKKVISEHRCSGARQAYPGIPGYYALYTEMPKPAPAFVKLMVRQPYFQETDTIASWARATAGNVTAKFLSAQPASLLVVDKLTREPLDGVQIWSAKTMAESTTNKAGKVVLPNVTPMSDRLYVVAKDYEAGTVNLKWPRGAMQRVELIKGGKTLSGTIVSTTGEPLPGATVTSGLSGYSATAVADENGKFEIYGLPKDQGNLYPVIEAPGFVTKGRFSFPLTNDDMTVKWELAPGATITGQIVHHETGEPIPGIKMTVGDSRFGGSNNKAPTATTNDNGRYRLIGVADGQNIVHAFSDDYAPEMKTVSVTTGTEATADFTLKIGKPITGTITDVDGKPIAGVWLVTDTWNGVRMFRREDRTNGKGEFTLAQMPDSLTEVHVLKSGYISHRELKVRGGETLELTMKPVITHTITVRDAAKGKIVPKLQIAKGYLWAGNNDWSWRSDDYETTRYYDKLKGAMKIEIDEPLTYKVAYRFRATGFKEEIVNIPEDAVVGKEFKVDLTPASVFSGRVVDAASGNPLSGIAVAIVSPGDQMRPDYYGEYTSPWQFLEKKRFSGQHTITDAAGGFRLSPPASSEKTSIALLSKEGGFHLITGLNDILTSSSLSEGVLELPFPKQSSVEGRVTVAGKPLANSKIRLSWTGYDGPTTRGNQSFGFGGQVTTDADGLFKYENVGPGTYQISRVFSFSLGQSSSMSTYIDTQNLVLLPGQSLTHNLTQPAGVSLSGITRDAEGKPVGDAFIRVNVNGDNSRQVAATASAADGSFKIEHLAPGSYVVSAQHYAKSQRGYNEQDMMGTTTVEVSEAVDGVTIEMGDTQRASAATFQRTAVPITKTLPPDFTVTPVGADKPFTLSENSGKVTVICFWASWANDATTISSIYEKYKDNSDVEFLTIFLQDEKQLRAYEKQQKVEFKFPITTTTPNASGQLISVFGISGQTACFVIGRDGRFAVEQTQSAQLATTIERVLAMKPSEAPAAAGPSQLAITLSADGSTRGINGARLALKAIGADGKQVRKDSYALKGVPRQIKWRYPELTSGGKLEITLSGKGVETRTETVSNPTAAEKLMIDVESPRVVSGKIATATDEKPVAGMQVRLQMYGGELLTTETDAGGGFSVRCFPGTYYIVAVGNDQFATASGVARSMTVAEDADPTPLLLKAVPAVSIKGQVVDQSGKPVEGATVSSQGGTTATSGAEGAFTLKGVASTGLTQIYAISSGVYGAIQLTSPDAEKTHKITLGQGLNNVATAAATSTVGGKVSEFDVMTLDGEKTKWQPESENARLLVFCALWHPASKAFLAKARGWSEENDTPIELVSLDWNLEQARREAAVLKLADKTVFAGPGKLNLDSQWPLVKGRGAFLIGSDGKLNDKPLD